MRLLKIAEGDYVINLGTLTKSYKITSNAQPIKPAEFQINELVIDPLSLIGGEVATVSVKVTNVGEETGSYTLDLKIDGVTRETKELLLPGGVTQTVNFEVTETASGTHSVMVGSLSGSFDVESLAPASENIEIASLIVRPYEVSEGDTVTIIAKANNLVNEPGTLQARVLVKDEIKSN